MKGSNWGLALSESSAWTLSENVEDLLDPGPERGADQVVAESLPFQDEAQPAGEEVERRALDVLPPGQAVAVGGQDLVDEEAGRRNGVSGRG